MFLIRRRPIGQPCLPTLLVLLPPSFLSGFFGSPFFHVITMVSRWLHLSQYMHIPQNVDDEGTFEKKDESPLFVQFQHKNLLPLVCLTCLTLFVGLTGFGVGIKVAQRQSGRPLFSDTVNQGLLPHEHIFETANEALKYRSAGLERLSGTTIALRARLQSQVVQSRYGTL